MTDYSKLSKTSAATLINITAKQRNACLYNAEITKSNIAACVTQPMTKLTVQISTGHEYVKRQKFALENRQASVSFI